MRGGVTEGKEKRAPEARVQAFGCPPGIRTPICCSRGSCPTIERGGNKNAQPHLAAVLAGATAGRGSPKANLFIIRGFSASVKPVWSNLLTCLRGFKTGPKAPSAPWMIQLFRILPYAHQLPLRLELTVHSAL